MVLGRIEDPVLVRIHRLARSLLRASTAYYLREFGLGVPHIQILNSIWNHGPMVSKDIAGNLTMNKGLISRSLAELTKAGYIESARDPNDARRRVWALKDSGKTFVLRWRPIGLKRQTKFLKVLTADERPMLVDILDRLYASSEKLRAEEALLLAKSRRSQSKKIVKSRKRSADAKANRSRRRVAIREPRGAGAGRRLKLAGARNIRAGQPE